MGTLISISFNRLKTVGIATIAAILAIFDLIFDLILGIED